MCAIKVFDHNMDFFFNYTNIDVETITELEKKLYIKCQWDIVCISLIKKIVMIAKKQMVIGLHLSRFACVCSLMTVT